MTHQSNENLFTPKLMFRISSNSKTIANIAILSKQNIAILNLQLLGAKPINSSHVIKKSPLWLGLDQGLPLMANTN